MDIFIGRDSEKQGPFTLYQIREMLLAEEISPETLGWIRDEVDEWKPLNDIPSVRRVIDELAQAKLDEELAARPSPEPPLMTPAPLSHPRLVFRQSISRFLARILDVMLFNTLALFLFRGWREPGATPEITMQRYQNDIEEISLIFMGSVLVWHLLEGFLISKFGTTPGKLAMNLRIRLSNGKNAGFGRSILRSYLVLFLGMGLMIWIFPMITCILGFIRMQSRGITIWDEQLKTAVVQGPVEAHRWILTIGALLALISILPRFI